MLHQSAFGESNLFDLHQSSTGRCWRRMLPSSPRIYDRYLVHAGNRAMRGAAFFGEVFAADVFDGVFFQRGAGISALL